jgi:hypothetical protein
VIAHQRVRESRQKQELLFSALLLLEVLFTKTFAGHTAST